MIIYEIIVGGFEGLELRVVATSEEDESESMRIVKVSIAVEIDI